MTDLPSNSLSQPSTSNPISVNSTPPPPSITPPDNNIINIPIEIVSDEEMAIIETAFVATRSSLSLCKSHGINGNVRSIASVTALSKRKLSIPSNPEVIDIEDYDFRSTQKMKKDDGSLYRRFRRTSGLFVTDITKSEWCEKQMEFSLTFGRKKVSEAMQIGTARHKKLEEEVVKRIRVNVQSKEDRWALKFLNFIIGANQLLSEGITRELPLVGVVEGVPITGIIDELRIPEGDSDRNPMLIDTKTRACDTLPQEPQRRNGKLQLMCYKLLWDDLVSGNFSSNHFFELLYLDPNVMLSKEIRETAAKAGIQAKTLNDIMRWYNTNTQRKLLTSNYEMLLRYESQKDNVVLGEDKFAFDLRWLKSRLQYHLEFLYSEREASYTPKEERWKCHHCQFNSVCAVGPVRRSHTETDGC